MLARVSICTSRGVGSISYAVSIMHEDRRWIGLLCKTWTFISLWSVLGSILSLFPYFSWRVWNVRSFVSTRKYHLARDNHCHLSQKCNLALTLIIINSNNPRFWDMASIWFWFLSSLSCRLRLRPDDRWIGDLSWLLLSNLQHFAGGLPCQASFYEGSWNWHFDVGCREHYQPLNKKERNWWHFAIYC